MSDVLHKTTKAQLFSVNTPDYSDSTWIINPDLSAVYSVPKRYWKIDGTTITEMNQTEKDATDAIILPDEQAKQAKNIQIEGDQFLINQGYTQGIQHGFNAMYPDGNRIRPTRGVYIQDYVNFVTAVNAEVAAKQAVIYDTTTIDDIFTITIDQSSLVAQDPGITMSGAIDSTDSTSLESFLDERTVVVDTSSGISGPYWLMQILDHRREIYNDSENPIYLSDHTAILGADGYLVEHANRILNLEEIHDKLGWHRLEVTEARYSRPKDVLFYYGYPNSFNSGVNGWNNENVAQDMAKYNMVVLGNGVADPTHPDFANTQVIIPRVQALNCATKVYGYVTSDQVFGDYTTEVEQWGALDVDGIFMDECGYDFGRTRAEFNQRVDYVHDRTASNICFANAWNTDHILGTANDVSYPNSTWNDTSAESNLTDNDWILLESFPINTSSYTSSAPVGYESASDWVYRGNKMVTLRYNYGVNFASVGIINNDNVDNTAMFDFSFISAMMYSLEGHGTSDTFYGASSATVNYYPRPDVSQMGLTYKLNCNVQQDGGDSDVYHKFVESGRFSLDFSDDTNQSSSITKY